MSHAVDVPITDLDVDDSDLSQVSEVDHNVLREDFEHGNSSFAFQQDSIFTRMRKSLIKLTSGNGYYSRVPKSIAISGIELRDRGDTIDSFDLGDDEFILRRQSSGLFSQILEKIKIYGIYALLFALLIVVIILSVFVSRKTVSKDTFKKQLLFNGTDSFYPTTILISLDGFHPHYISKQLTPALHRIFTEGYGAPYMKPSFPSSTFPNHWSIATGLHPESHGIVGNTFFSPKLGKQFINVIPEKSLDPLFWGGEPIWSTAELQSVKSAIHMFPGSEVIFPSGNPTEVDKYNGTETLEVKIKRLTEWLDRDIRERPELVLAYVPTIDSLGHKYGIKGPELENGLKYVDSFIQNVLSAIENRNLTDIVNLVIVSDHGMAPTSEHRLVYLDELLNTTKIQHVDGWPLFGLRPYPEHSVEEVFYELKSNFKENQGYSIYLREDLPSHFHFGGEETVSNKEFYDRIAPIWVIPDVGYSITTHDDMERKGGIYSPKGVHGYDNDELLMRAIFLGQGPYFSSKSDEDGKVFKVKPFQNIEVYGILCEMLNIKPSLNQGTANFLGRNHIDVYWKDELRYPNVGFDIGGILKVDSTYDALFAPEKHTTTLKPQNGATSTELTEETEVEEHKILDTNKTTEAKLDETTTEKEATETNEKGEGLWDKIEDLMDDIADDLDDIGDDLKDQLDEWLDDITDAFDS